MIIFSFLNKNDTVVWLVALRCDLRIGNKYSVCVRACAVRFSITADKDHTGIRTICLIKSKTLSEINHRTANLIVVRGARR